MDEEIEDDPNARQEAEGPFLCTDFESNLLHNG